MPLLLDVAELTDAQTDLALDFLCKAHGEDALSDAIFDQHPSPFIRRLVELFYERGLLRLTDCRDELGRWLEGVRHDPGPIPVRPDGAMLRWSPAEMQLVRIYLSALPPSQFAMDDYLLLTDFLFQRYLPADDLRSEADWLATRATLMGRIQANLDHVTDAQADTLLAALPASAAAAKQTFDMTRAEGATIDYASAHAMENAVAFSDSARHRIKETILQVTQANIAERPGNIASTLKSRLFDQFADLNRDWRRIAVTEAGEAMNQGVTASLPEGARVKRVEQYRGACPFCRRIDGHIMTVVAADAPEKDGATQIWPGKTNVGRALAPRKRVGDALIEREPHERWWIPAGLAHPHCRGRWVPTARDEPVDPNFSLWIDRTLGDSRAEG
jgi:hypothetical protein